MEKPFFLVISGWGFPPAAWEPARQCAAPVCELRVLDPLDLLDPATAGLAANAIERLHHALPSNRPCFLGGWSLGAIIALQCARELAPGIVGLLLISATLRFCRHYDHPWGPPPAELRALRQALLRDPTGVLCDFHRRAAAPSLAVMPAWIDEATAKAEKLATGLRYLERTDLRQEDLPMGQPVLLLHGQEDEVIPLAAARYLAARLASCRLDTVEDAGHDLPLRHGEHFAEAATRLVRMGK